MEMILINKSRLKVMLTPEDMKDYDICPDMTDTKNPQSRKVFWNILDKAREKTGFNPDKNKVFVQIYPSRCGGCEMFVTRIGESSEEEKIVKEYPPLSVYPAGKIIYTFDDMEHMLMTCSHLLNVEYEGESSAYSDKSNSRVYLVLEREVMRICEFGGVRCRTSAIYYILEHCDLICHEAVYKLGVLA